MKSAPGERSGVGLATIPRDRFAGIRPVARSDQPTLRRPLENIGQITLKPLKLARCRDITVNADAAAGAIRLEPCRSIEKPGGGAAGAVGSVNPSDSGVGRSRSPGGARRR